MKQVEMIQSRWRRTARLLCGRGPPGRCRFLSTIKPNPPPVSAALADGDDNVCLLAKRHIYHSWPSEEHAAFAFARLASPGRTTIESEEFLSVLHNMKLDFNLGNHELERVFNSLDKNGDGKLSLEEFKNGRGDHPFTKALVEALSGSALSLFCKKQANSPDEFDWKVSTADFYSANDSIGFVGENIAIRKSLDYSYHNNYTHARQIFQDELIKNNVILDGSRSESPWLVLTCGPMGAGKGWVLGWMSSNGILPLERVSKIDPDAFKLRMPEWSIYQKHSVEVAGSRTHAESSYIAEIAQNIAMNNGMDVWVDGSLRNWLWYKEALQRIRQRYPHYRIAIVAIDASEDMIERNIQKRAKMTGRHISNELRDASSQGVERGLRELTHLVDLIAIVRNSLSAAPGEAISEPTLRSVSMVDRSGNWDLIGVLTNK